MALLVFVVILLVSSGVYLWRSEFPENRRSWKRVFSIVCIVSGVGLLVFGLLVQYGFIVLG